MLSSSLNTLILPLLNVAVSALVVRLTSLELWGELVGLLIIVQLGAHLIGWGNKEYLLREFSLRPAEIAHRWQSSLVTRLALLVLLCGILALLRFPPARIVLLGAWVAGLALAQSCDALVVYKRDFVVAALVEGMGLALIVAAVALLGEGISAGLLAALFAAAALLKGLVLAVRFRRIALPAIAGRFEPGYFSQALPFFVLGLSGMLQSRVDLYCVAAFLPRADVAAYQVFINLMIYLQSIANALLAPFTRSLYRLENRAILRIAARLLLVGALIVPPALVAIHVALTMLYDLRLAPPLLLLGGLFALPVFAYLPVIYALYKSGQQWVVLRINILGIAVNLLLNLLLLERLGMSGALLAGATAQWAMLVAYAGWARIMRARYAPLVSELP